MGETHRSALLKRESYVNVHYMFRERRGRGGLYYYYYYYYVSCHRLQITNTTQTQITTNKQHTKHTNTQITHTL